LRDLYLEPGATNVALNVAFEVVVSVIQLDIMTARHTIDFHGSSLRLSVIGATP